MKTQLFSFDRNILWWGFLLFFKNWEMAALASAPSPGHALWKWCSSCSWRSVWSWHPHLMRRHMVLSKLIPPEWTVLCVNLRFQLHRMGKDWEGPRWESLQWEGTVLRSSRSRALGALHVVDCIWHTHSRVPGIDPCIYGWGWVGRYREVTS